MKKDLVQDEFLRKRAVRQRKIRKRRQRIFFISLIMLLLTALVILCFTVFFKIDALTATGSKTYTVEQIIEASDINLGDNLFVTSESKVLKRLKAKLPYIESIEFERKLPGSLNIIVKDATEWAGINEDGFYYIISKAGWVMKRQKEPPQNIFTIKGVKAKCSVGKEIVYNDSDRQELVQKLTDALTKEKLKINLIDVTDSVGIRIKVDDRFDVFLGNANYISEKVRHLATMVEEIPAEKSGKVNLSMWTNDNPEATFVEETNE